MSDEAMQKVLEDNDQKILQKSREAIDQPKMLSELKAASEQLAKQEVPGKDGVGPVEFFLALCHLIGPILLEVLRMGLEEGSLHPQLPECLMVLLAKEAPSPYDVFSPNYTRGWTLCSVGDTLLVLTYLGMASSARCPPQARLCFAH